MKETWFLFFHVGIATLRTRLIKSGAGGSFVFLKRMGQRYPRPFTSYTMGLRKLLVLVVILFVSAIAQSKSVGRENRHLGRFKRQADENVLGQHSQQGLTTESVIDLDEDVAAQRSPGNYDIGVTEATQQTQGNGDVINSKPVDDRQTPSGHEKSDNVGDDKKSENEGDEKKSHEGEDENKSDKDGDNEKTNNDDEHKKSNKDGVQRETENGEDQTKSDNRRDEKKAKNGETTQQERAGEATEASVSGDGKLSTAASPVKTTEQATIVKLSKKSGVSLPDPKVQITTVAPNDVTSSEKLTTVAMAGKPTEGSTSIGYEEKSSEYNNPATTGYSSESDNPVTTVANTGFRSTEKPVEAAESEKPDSK